MLIDNLHTEVTSQIKWKGALSDKFNINQGVRQGGVLSTGEYKGFNNNLLFKLTNSLSGSRLGSIQCGAPTCADDIAVVADSPVDLQILLDIAADYSHSEHYELQPTKYVIFPFNNTTSLDWPWEILGHELPIVDTTTHIGVKRDSPSGGLLSAQEVCEICAAQEVCVICAAQEVCEICAAQEVCEICAVQEVCVICAAQEVCEICAAQEVFCGVCATQEVICAVQEVIMFRV